MDDVLSKVKPGNLLAIRRGFSETPEEVVKVKRVLKLYVEDERGYKWRIKDGRETPRRRFGFSAWATPVTPEEAKTWEVRRLAKVQRGRIVGLTWREVDTWTDDDVFAIAVLIREAMGRAGSPPRKNE